MLHLTKVLPVELKLDSRGKKIPVGGMYAKNKINYKPGMHNFAIHLLDYPDIVVLDLDSRDHPLKKYIDKTYTHKTRKGWHCFFRNTYKITTKRQKQKEKFDLLAGNNWCFYDYNDPEVAQYIEYNQLPIVDMPQELFELVKTKASDLGEKPLSRFIPQPLLNVLKTNKSLWNPSIKKWRPGLIRIVDNVADYDSSALAWAIINELLAYTDEPEHIAAVLKLIPEIGEKHSTIDYLTSFGNGGSIGAAKRHITANKKINWRPLSDFRAIRLGDKTAYVDISDNTVVKKESLRLFTLPKTKVELIEEFLETYHNVDFRPDIPHKFYDNLYNLFEGFVEPEIGNDHEMYLEFLKDVVCDNNEEHYNYLLNYIAHIVQKPEERPDVAIVLFGHQKGTGKDTFHVLLGRILKGNGYVPLSHESLFGRFNKQLESALIGSAEELVFGGSHKEDSALKRVITMDKHTIERKGFEPYTINNYLRLIITSNSNQPVRATDGERRFFALKPNIKRKNDYDYWTELYNNFNPKHLMNYLLTVDISEFNPRKIPLSENLQEIIDHNKDRVTEMIETWWDEVAYSGIRLSTKQLFQTIVSESEVHNKYITLRQFTSLVFEICGKQHFLKSFNKEMKSHYQIVNHPKGLENMPEGREEFTYADKIEV